MREIARKFSELEKRGEGALIAYVTAGDPSPQATPEVVRALVEGGADIVELGIPFSDPIADGPTIQAATVRALRAGTRPRMVLEMVEKIKQETRTPIVILSYYNPIFKMGLKSFFEEASARGVDGVVVPDLPVEEAGEYKEYAEAYEVDTIFLAAPSTSTERLKKIVDYTSGFLYLVSVFGVTGAREKIQEITVETIRRALHFTRGRIPLAVGFGVSKPEHVSRVLELGADAAIVGSRLVRIIEENVGDEEKMIESLRSYTRQLKEATHRKGK
ncbi:MAG: tryptophan synthase subunit alpha [Candidatus Jordarchaeales archaeon]